MKDFMDFSGALDGEDPTISQGADRFTTGTDYNGDGIMDGEAVYEDLNGDGVFDTITASVDTNGDGIVDFVSAYQDTNGDGFTDYSATLMDVDTNGDGIADSVFFGEDANGDTVFETTQIMDAEEWAMFTGGPDSGYVPVDEGGGFDAGYEQFNPAETDMSQVVGTPAADEQCWNYQGESGPCAIYAQVMAYEGMTGQDIDPEQMIDIATEQGWYDGTGTTLEDMDKVLNYLGAETEKGFDGNMEDLHNCLENGGRIVVAVDGNEIWYGNTETYAPNDPNHAVEVIGIDYSSPEPMVIINDSGTMDGHAITVPASQFMDAWEDSGCYYVEAYA